MGGSSVVAEYAKSNRSTCKACSKSIVAKALRVGTVVWDNRGFDVTKWYHLACFPLCSHSLPSPVEAIRGFSSLKNCDQEALEKFFAGNDNSQEKVNKANEGIQNEPPETKESDSKRRKLCPSDAETAVNINFSVSDVKSKYKDATILPKWKAFQTVIFLERNDAHHDSSKIAAFDFDGCLAKTSMNRVGADAWSLNYSSIPNKLQSLYNDGYKLVIFTNESNIERWKNKRQVFIACGLGKSGKADSKEDDPFSKPKPGMWLLMEQHLNSGIAIDMDQLFSLPFKNSALPFNSSIDALFYIPVLNLI